MSLPITPSGLPALSGLLMTAPGEPCGFMSPLSPAGPLPAATFNTQILMVLGHILKLFKSVVAISLDLFNY